MQVIKALALTFLASAVLASSASAEVQLTIRDGRVSLTATDATVRQILTEWARVGQTKLVNVERITGAPVTLQLTNVTEEEALDVLLRSTSGYMVAPRQVMASNVSRFDRIIVMPTLAAAAAPLSGAPPPSAAPMTFSQTTPPPSDEDRDDAGPNPPAGAPQPPSNRGPVFVFPQPQVTGVPPQPAPGQVNVPQGTPPTFFPQQQQQPPAPPAPGAVSFPGAPATSSPAGVAVPGMIVPAPAQQPGQQPAPQQ